MLMLTACNDNDNTQKFDFSQTFCQRVSTGENVYYSQTAMTGSLNYGDDLTVSMTINTKLDESNTVEFSTGDMDLTTYNSYCYKFSKASINAGNYVISNLMGYYDTTLGTVWLTYTVNSTAKVYGSGYMLYPYVTTTVTDMTDESKTAKTTNSAYYITPASDGESATLKISNFHTDATESIGEEVITFNNLSMSAKENGYIVYGDDLSDTNSKYTLKGLVITLNKQGTAIEGMYYMDDYTVDIAGTMFVTNVPIE